MSAGNGTESAFGEWTTFVDQRLANVEERLGRLERSFERIEERISNLETNQDLQLNALQQILLALGAKKSADEIDAHLQNRLKRLDNRPTDPAPRIGE